MSTGRRRFLRGQLLAFLAGAGLGSREALAGPRAEAQRATSTNLPAQDVNRARRIAPLMEPWGDVAPDGRSLVFTTITQNLFLARTDGTGQKPLSAGKNDYAPVWSPDGKEIAFVSGRAFFTKGRRAYVIKPETGETRQLTPDDRNNGDDRVVWSHDGTRLAVKQEYSGPIDLISVSGTPVRRIDARASSLIDWSPDGHTVLAGVWNEHTKGLVLVPTGKGEAAVLVEAKTVPMPGYFASPAWSPDGTRILFLTGSPLQTSLSVIDLETSRVACLTPEKGISASAPVWSPDGAWIAFAQGGDIWTMRADGGGKRNLTRAGGYHDYPRWLPDGKQIVYVGFEKQGYDLFAINREGSKTTRLTDHGGVGRRASMFR